MMLYNTNQLEVNGESPDEHMNNYITDLCLVANSGFVEHYILLL